MVFQNRFGLGTQTRVPIYVFVVLILYINALNEQVGQKDG